MYGKTDLASEMSLQQRKHRQNVAEGYEARVKEWEGERRESITFFLKLREPHTAYSSAAATLLLRPKK